MMFIHQSLFTTHLERHTDLEHFVESTPKYRQTRHLFTGAGEPTGTFLWQKQNPDRYLNVDTTGKVRATELLVCNLVTLLIGAGKSEFQSVRKFSQDTGAGLHQDYNVNVPQMYWNGAHNGPSDADVAHCLGQIVAYIFSRSTCVKGNYTVT